MIPQLYATPVVYLIKGIVGNNSVAANFGFSVPVPVPSPQRSMIVVTNRIPVAKGHEIDFEDRFRNRAHLIDQAPGFIRNEVHRPKPMKFDHESGGFVDDPDAEGYYEVKTWWRTMEDFAAWTRSPAFAEAHANRPPKEMFRGPSVLDVHEVFLSTDVT